MRIYNFSQIGEKSFPSLLIELTDEKGRRLGAIAGQISWDYFCVLGFYVEAEYRGSGMGKALIEAAAVEARKRFGAPRMEFVTNFPELSDYLLHMGWVKEAELAICPRDLKMDSSI